MLKVGLTSSKIRVWDDQIIVVEFKRYFCMPSKELKSWVFIEKGEYVLEDSLQKGVLK